MNETAVISCPQCLRQYEVDAATDSLVAQCGVCKACFTVAIPRLTGTVENVLVLDKEIEPHYVFFKEACETMARKACELLPLAGEPVTAESIAKFVASIPMDRGELSDGSWRDGFFFHSMAKANDLHPSGQDRARFVELADYFLSFIERERSAALGMLIAAFSGVLGGIEWSDLKQAERPEQKEGIG